MSEVDPTATAEETTADASAAAGGSAEAAAADTPMDVPHDAGAEAAATESVVGEISEDAVVALIAERDDYLDQLQRMKAEFANARRRSQEQAADVRKHAAADLVTKLLPVLDSAQAAIDQGVDEVRPLCDALFEVLTGQGLSRLDPVGEPFDPEQHEAVLFEPGDDDGPAEQVVAETMRLGYVWNERVLRAAMVKVRG